MCCYLSLFATEIWAAWVPVTFFTACKKEATEGEQYGHCSDGITEIKIVLKDGISFWGHLINITTATTGLAKPHPLVPTTVCYDPNENLTRTTMKLDEHCTSQCTISAVRLNYFKLKIFIILAKQPAYISPIGIIIACFLLKIILSAIDRIYNS